MSAVLDHRIDEEMCVLESILMTDVVINKTDPGIPKIEAIVHPLTADDVDQQFVCLTLEVKLIPGYPDTSPEVTLRNPRGLDDEVLKNIHKEVNRILRTFLGTPVVYEIIGLLREMLTVKNLPSEPCVICLYNFEEGDTFIKTQCYHYFHSHCFGKHLIAGKKNYEEEMEKLPAWKRSQEPPYQQTCPVCRSPVSFDADALKSAPPPVKSLDDPPFQLTPEIKAQQKEMKALKMYQEAKGGAVSPRDSGPPPLTITSPSELNESANEPGPSGLQGQARATRSQDEPKASGSKDEPKRSGSQEELKAAGNSRSNASNNAATPGSPNAKPGSPNTKPAYTGPYRGFNRRGKPGRRGRGAAGTR